MTSWGFAHQLLIVVAPGASVSSALTGGLRPAAVPVAAAALILSERCLILFPNAWISPFPSLIPLPSSVLGSLCP